MKKRNRRRKRLSSSSESEEKTQEKKGDFKKEIDQDRRESLKRGGNFVVLMDCPPFGETRIEGRILHFDDKGKRDSIKREIAVAISEIDGFTTRDRLRRVQLGSSGGQSKNRSRA